MSLEFFDQKSTTNKNGITTNYMKVILNEKAFELPMISASKSDYDKTIKNNGEKEILLNTNTFQYYVNLLPQHWKHITTIERQEKIIENFNKIYNKYTPTVSDINFWWDGHTWDDNERNIVLTLQTKLKTDFISDVIMDRDLLSLNPDLNEEEKLKSAIEKFDKQLLSLQNFDSDKIKCPTVSMKTPLPVFKKQLEKIESHSFGFKRFNVDWTGLSNLEPWLVLTKFLKGKEIWCNMTSVNVRRRIKKIKYEDTKKEIKVRRSNLQIALAFGAHSAGLGYYIYPHDEDEEPTAYLLNRETLLYEVDDNEDYKFDDSVSFNRLCEKVYQSHNYIKTETFFKNYLPIDYLS